MEDRGEVEGDAPAPRANRDLVGHDAVERELLRLYQAGRLPHAILFGGPRGIGKATLAFRFARFLLARGTMSGGGAGGLAIDPASGVFRRVAAGGHADLFTVERNWDPQRRRLRGGIVVEHTRDQVVVRRYFPRARGSGEGFPRDHKQGGQFRASVRIIQALA